MQDAIQNHLTHHWAATGVSSYPIHHKIIGQRQFYKTFEHFIHLIDDEQEAFAHVFALIAPWGVGKSRLGYELIAQINDTSPGWFIQDEKLNEAKLFRNEEDREQYLGLYIRYSQIATEYQNIDNWFAFGLYKALQPLAKEQFDGSIQGSIAQESFDRLLVNGFEASKLAEALEIEKNYTDNHLYEDQFLLTRLCQNAYQYLSQFGIKYILIVLDELETVAEASTYGLDQGDIKGLDGRAIKLLGKAIKEEDPRKKLHWLRYIALCSPAVGDELRDIQSTQRRFELVELARNTFSDVSYFVQELQASGKLRNNYPKGLIEAAYAMSGGNFGWFNVVMANVDEVLNSQHLRGENNQLTIGQIFNELVERSSRVREYILDHQVIRELNIGVQNIDVARELLFGQLPVSLNTWSSEIIECLLNAKNEYDEPIATYFTTEIWDEKECSRALRQAKFEREKHVWKLSGTDQTIDLQQLLENLETYAIHLKSKEKTEPGKHQLLLPLNISEFIQLVNLVYPEPAAEDAARALWSALIGKKELDNSVATHIGPSIIVLNRLNLRLRAREQNTLIFRNPDLNNLHEKAIKALKNQPIKSRNQQILVGLIRLVNNYWGYNYESANIADNEITTALVSSREGEFVNRGLRLHPKGRLLLAWVDSEKDLDRLCEAVTQQFKKHGKTPVLCFTSSRYLYDQFETPSTNKLKEAKNYLMLELLTASEEFILNQIGLSAEHYENTNIDPHQFTTAFSIRLETIRRNLDKSIRLWREELSQAGMIAWPFIPKGSIKDDERDALFTAWSALLTSQKKNLAQLDENSNVDLAKFRHILEKLAQAHLVTRIDDYGEHEKANLFTTTDDRAEIQIPPFVLKLIDELLNGKQEDQVWTFERAERDWFWGYTWLGAKPKQTYLDWMSLLCELEFLELHQGKSGQSEKEYIFVSRGQLKSCIQEANNWLNTDYPKTVENMKSIFGPGKVEDYFGQEKGSKTLVARSRLEEAEKSLSRLETLESNFYKQTAELKETDFVKAAHLRKALIVDVDKVYNKTEYEQLSLSNTRTIRFEGEEHPLWERIGLAKLCAERVKSKAIHILDRIEHLSHELKEQVKNYSGFPINLFTLSLQTIGNIIQVIIEPDFSKSETQKQQPKEPGTLIHYLRELKITEAMDKLSDFAKEVGLNLDSIQELPPEEINGVIISGFYKFLHSFDMLHHRMEELETKLTLVLKKFEDLPQDFVYPDEVPKLEKLNLRLEEIKDTFLILPEEANLIRSEFSSQTRLGQFHILMDEAEKRLFQEIRPALNKYSGYITTLENQGTGYLKRLLDNDKLQKIEHGFNALLQAQGKTVREPLKLLDLEQAGNLKNANDLVKQRCEAWVNEGMQILQNVEIGFDRWQEIAWSLNHEIQPELTSVEAELLIKQGFLRVFYQLNKGRSL